MSTAKTKIILDIGSELDEGSHPTPPQIAGLFDRQGYDAVFISHYHIDHMGLAPMVHGAIPIYVGRSALAILCAAARYKNETLPENFIPFDNGRALAIGDLTITPILVDHSAFDAYMILVSDGHETALYTGDFRANGRKSFSRTLAALPRKLDYLICEGTSLSRNGHRNISERELEETAAKLIQSHTGPVFVLQSTMNVDRIVSFYRAAKKARRLFLQDLYMAELVCAAGCGIPNPKTFHDVRAFIPRSYPSGHFRYDLFQRYGIKKIGKTRIANGRFLMCVRSSMGRFLSGLRQAMTFDDGLLIYSMWTGYQAQPEMQIFLDSCTRMGLTLVNLHTSGHADEQTILDFIKYVNPATIIPVHTENANWFHIHFEKIIIID